MGEVEIGATERLFVPHRKRLSHTYTVNSDGVRELRIDYGVKEITFDDERLFAFGEHICLEPSFSGQDAVTWGPGYAWEELQPLLVELLAEGILQRGERDDDRPGGLVPSRVSPSVCPVARTWSTQTCESITHDLANRPIEIGYLEAIVPVFRIAHSALDADDRQVGEANVYPPALRLDRDTEWRTCQYAGSRYRDDKPMNITALKAMIKYWKPMMAAILSVRAELAQRFGRGAEAWTACELHTLSSVVLALPAFQLMLGGGVVPQPPLHPVLSSLFRITDGVRMTTFEMLFAPVPTHRTDDPLGGEELFAYAERYGVLLGDTGVCAGPEHLIREFLAVVVDGKPAERTEQHELAPEIRGLLDQLPAAVDYGLLGLQVWCVAASPWFAVSRACEALLAILDQAPATDDAAIARLHARLRADWQRFERVRFTTDADRAAHWNVYDAAYQQARAAALTSTGDVTLAAEVGIGPAGAMHDAAAAQLRALLAPRLRFDALEPLIDRLVYYLREEQAVAASVTRLQEAINAQLDRPSPTRAVSVKDLHAYYPMGNNVFSYVIDSIEHGLGIRIDCTAEAITISAQ
jgi:hypothetical protein